jgi:DNA phosphorothioation-associated putative methyltransferase
MKSHLTAISRNKLSAPMQFLLDNSVLEGKKVLDYGCGKGQDVERLRAMGVDIVGYDPHFSPDLPEGFFDIITCNFVLNVIPEEEERREVVHYLKFKLVKPTGQAFISVRNDKSNLNGLTKRGTWQGYIDLDLPLAKVASSFRMYKLEEEKNLEGLVF